MVGLDGLQIFSKLNNSVIMEVMGWTAFSWNRDCFTSMSMQIFETIS